MDSPPSTTAEDSACSAARCPLCGGPNACQLCTVAAYKGPCWCEGVEFPESLLARVPAELRRRACVCRACVEAERQRSADALVRETAAAARTVRAGNPPQPDPASNDSYLDPSTGFLVFTEAYHLKRGHCCDSGCRHCPYGKCEVRSAKCEVADAAGELDTASRTTPHAPRTALLTTLLLLFLATWSGGAAVIEDDFATDPLANGWRAFGDLDLFRWDAANGQLAATWDSARLSSFFARPLGTTLTAADDFAFELDLRLTDAGARDTTQRPAALQVAFGLVNLARLPAGHPARTRGIAQDLVEFDWFPASTIPGYGENPATVAPVVFGGGTSRAFSFDNYFDLADGATWRVRCAYRATTRQLTTTLLRAGADAGPVNPVKLPDTFISFAVDAFAVIAWSEAATAVGSLLAHGTLDRVRLELPDPPLGTVTMTDLGVVKFASVNGWRYTLEASDDLRTWDGILTAAGTGDELVLADLREALFARQFYRVRAERP